MEVRFVNSLSGVLRDRRNPIRIKQGIVAQRLDVGSLIFAGSAHLCSFRSLFCSAHHPTVPSTRCIPSSVFQPPN